MSHLSPEKQALAIELFRGSRIPLYVCLPSLTWVLCDYLYTLQDEIEYIWAQNWNLGKLAYLWVRYYTIMALTFDVAQIHSFAKPGVANANICVAMYPVTKLVGALLLWSIEIVMQLRVYALYRCSKKVAAFNGVLFTTCLGLYLWLLVINTQARMELIVGATSLTDGCPTIRGSTEWALWIPPSIFEGVLFLFAISKTFSTIGSGNVFSGSEKGASRSVLQIVTRDNLLYFLGIASILLFNILMNNGNKTKIPWLSYGPFHASMGIMTSHMLMHLRKATSSNTFLSHTGPTQVPDENWIQHTMQFGDRATMSRSEEDSFEMWRR